jgi:hypothetical protein
MAIEVKMFEILTYHVIGDHCDELEPAFDDKPPVQTYRELSFSDESTLKLNRIKLDAQNVRISNTQTSETAYQRGTASKRRKRPN